MEVSSLFEQQRAEAKVAMLRIFRFKARRGVGVFYALVSLLLLGVWAITRVFSSPLLVFAGLVAGASVTWYAAKAAGFRGYDQMAYSLEFLEGGDALVLDRKRWYTNPAFLRFVTLSSGAAFLAAEAEGLSTLSLAILTIWAAQSVLLRVFILSRSKDGVLDRRPEDWAVIAMFPLMLVSAVATGTPIGGVLLSVPIYLLAGLKSLYDAPKELSRVAF
jgi:hypothetical protein